MLLWIRRLKVRILPPQPPIYCGPMSLEVRHLDKIDSGTRFRALCSDFVLWRNLLIRRAIGCRRMASDYVVEAWRRLQPPRAIHTAKRRPAIFEPGASRS